MGGGETANGLILKSGSSEKGAENDASDFVNFAHRDMDLRKLCY